MSSGLFQANYKEEEQGSQTEVKDTLAQDEHIKRMPTGQMEMLYDQHTTRQQRKQERPPTK